MKLILPCLGIAILLCLTISCGGSPPKATAQEVKPQDTRQLLWDKARVGMTPDEVKAAITGISGDREKVKRSDGTEILLTKRGIIAGRLTLAADFRFDAGKLVGVSVSLVDPTAKDTASAVWSDLLNALSLKHGKPVWVEKERVLIVNLQRALFVADGRTINLFGVFQDDKEAVIRIEYEAVNKTLVEVL